MGFLAGTSKFFGNAFLGLGLTLLLFGLLMGFVVENVDSLRGRGDEVIESMFSSPEFLDTLIQQGESQYGSLEEVKVVCEANPALEGCEILEQIEENPIEFITNNTNFDAGIEEVNSQIDELADNIENAEHISDIILTVSIVLVILGVLLIFFGWLDWKEAGYKIAVKSAIITGLAALYYKFIQILLVGDALAGRINIAGIPLDPIREFLSSWIDPAFNKVFLISLILCILFVAIAIWLYFFKEKDLKKENKKK